MLGIGLPIELLEEVLMKSFVLMHVPFYKGTHQSIQNKTVYKTLTSVCSTWRSVPKHKRGFAKTLRVQHDKRHNLGESLHIYEVHIVNYRVYRVYRVYREPSL